MYDQQIPLLHPPPMDTVSNVSLSVRDKRLRVRQQTLLSRWNNFTKRVLAGMTQVTEMESVSSLVKTLYRTGFERMEKQPAPKFDDEITAANIDQEERRLKYWEGELDAKRADLADWESRLDFVASGAELPKGVGGLVEFEESNRKGGLPEASIAKLAEFMLRTGRVIYDKERTGPPVPFKLRRQRLIHEQRDFENRRAYQALLGKRIKETQQATRNSAHILQFALIMYYTESDYEPAAFDTPITEHNVRDEELRLLYAEAWLIRRNDIDRYMLMRLHEMRLGFHEKRIKFYEIWNRDGAHALVEAMQSDMEYARIDTDGQFIYQVGM
ncbi:hypothetical protein BJ508DRAFT_311350 [Ascobolus immersus RN42]|uniref:Uncharacterized protein n=1 Tax=Ascobolus immersus RN42 TaxID=1160509 RepID=A0A3N4HQM1_ASCIM|nr:hypothetical protein BJ508DRAFT_311350 [Ascobolus immersus RN42]